MLEKVQKTNCNNCLFTKNRIVNEERKKQILDTCRKNKSKFICHKASKTKQEVTCRGFYEQENNQEIKIMLEMLGQVNFVTVE